MNDTKLQGMFKEENEHLQYKTQGIYQSLCAEFWGFLRNYSQNKIEQIKVKQKVTIQTTQFVPVRVERRAQRRVESQNFFYDPS